MSTARLVRNTLAAATVTLIAMSGWVMAQGGAQPVNDLPNQYQTVENYFKLPEGRTWGSTSAVDIDKDGRSIWIAERCGANSCAGSNLDPMLKFDASGKLVRSFGGGMLLFPHGIHVDRDGNIWVTDAQGPDPKNPASSGKGHQVIKFSPDGKVLMRLGMAGMSGDPASGHLTEPNDVITAPNGDIFVAEGHSGQSPNAKPDTVARVSKFSKDGKFIKSWGKLGSAPGEFRTPHGLAFDSQGRLFVADRGNVRIQVFDQEGKFLQETKAFSRLSGIYIRGDMLYGADSESSPQGNPGWRRGMRIGTVKDLKPMYFIPDPAHSDLQKAPSGTSAAEGVAVDAAGNIYGAEVGPRGVKKYTRRAAQSQ
jgi:sugar lactone lactonase YvrE